MPTLHLSAALHATARKTDGVELVHEQDARSRRSGLRVFAREPSTLPEERNDDERVDTHPHASKARRVDVDERKLRLRSDDTREERLSCPGLTREEHSFRHLATGKLEALDTAEDPDERLRVIDEIRLSAVVVEAEPELGVVGCHRVGARAREEPHEQAELRDEREGVEDEGDEKARHLADECGETFEHTPDAIEEEDQREDPQKDQQAPLVVLEHIRARRHYSSCRQFTPTT
jgi:hypothetical protein